MLGSGNYFAVKRQSKTLFIVTVIQIDIVSNADTKISEFHELPK